MASFDVLMKDLLEDTFTGTDIKCGLLDSTASYTHDPATQDFVSDLPTGSEPSDASYSRQTVSNLQFNEDNTDNEGVFDFDDVTFGSLSTTNDIEAVFFYSQDGHGSAGTDDTTPGDDKLIVVLDDDSGDSGGIADLPKSTNGSDLTINLDSEGVLNISTPT